MRVEQVKYNPAQLEFMPAFNDTRDTHEWIGQRYSCSPDQAREFANQLIRIWNTNREESVITYYKAECAWTGREMGYWRGRKTRPTWHKWGLVSPRDDKDGLVWALVRIIGHGHVTKDTLRAGLEGELGEGTGDYWIGRMKRELSDLVKYEPEFRTYRFRHTHPARSLAQVSGPSDRRAADLEQYGAIPAEGLRRIQPGQPYDPATDETRAFIMKVNPNITDETCPSEFRRIMRHKVWIYKTDADDHAVGRYYPRPVKAPDIAHSTPHTAHTPTPPTLEELEAKRIEDEAAKAEAQKEWQRKQAEFDERLRKQKEEREAREAAALKESMRIAAIEDAERLRKHLEAQERKEKEDLHRQTWATLLKAEGYRSFRDLFFHPAKQFTPRPDEVEYELAEWRKDQRSRDEFNY
jgi:hypothetical protein